jgi:phospholipid transport system substrate-binding protein
MLKRITLAAVIALVMIIVWYSPSKAESATERVRIILDKAMEIQTRPDLAGESHRAERAKLIRQLISENFLSSEMAKEALGETWDRISQKQRSEFQNLFVLLFQDSYTRMVLNFLQKENVEYRGESPEGKGMLVKTVIMRSNEHIPVDYHLSQKNGRWYIHDVDIDGVSIVKNYRNSFRKVIQSGSFDSLLQKMRVQSKALQD